MRKDEERQRKFHDSLLKVLYPPPPSPPPHQGRDEEEPLIVLQDCLNLDGNSGPLQDELGLSGSSSSSSSSVDEVEPGPQKLTRAQRKRLRKKKLKEAVSRRRKTIGPLLPNTPADDNRHGDLRIEPQGVRPNVAEEFEVRKANSGKDVTDEFDVGNAIPGEPEARMNQNKRKQRRMAKKLSRERSNSLPFVVNGPLQ